MGRAGSTASSQLDELRRRTAKAYMAGDAESAAELYVDEGVQHPPGRPAVVGRDAIRATYALLFGRGGLALRMEPWETVVSGGEARERGAYHLSSGGQTLLVGKYIFVAAKSDGGEWRYVWSTVTPD